MALVAGYRQFGGQHAETASLTNVLAAQGVVASNNGKPYSEAMLLGIGGGLGAGYILFEFKAHHTKVLVIGWQNRWQYWVHFYETLCERIGVIPTFHEAGSPKAASKQLTDALDAGKPVVAWVDRAGMPYLQLPESLRGHIGHIVAICGMEDDTIWVDDLAAKPFAVSVEAMIPARGRISSFKNRLLEITPNRTPDMAEAVLTGIRDCVEHLSQKSDSFSLPTFRKWGKMMTDRKNAKGWHVAFADRRGLYGALRSIYEGVELVDATGGGLRGLYADFLEEAAELLSRPSLRQAAARFRDLAAQWTRLADAALPDQVEPFRETRQLLRQRHNLLLSKGDDAAAQMLPLTERLGALQSKYNPAFPLSDAEVDRLFSTLGEQLLALYDAETAALEQLRGAIEG
jgi:hypothetical protein